MSGIPDLWQFSLVFYARRDVASACLVCQDEADADVNLILFLLWQSTRGVRVTPDEVAAIDEAVRDWREQVVQPLRAVRRFLKGTTAVGTFREAVKTAELDAEHYEQQLLATYARPAGQAEPNAAAANLRAYEAATGRALPATAVTTLLDELAR